MSVIDVRLVIQADEYVRLYSGSVRDVVATAMDGRIVRFPARILQPYVTREGVRGSYRITFDDRGKFKSISRLSP